jgi:hypothetical protein
MDTNKILVETIKEVEIKEVDINEMQINNLTIITKIITIIENSNQIVLGKLEEEVEEEANGQLIIIDPSKGKIIHDQTQITTEILIMKVLLINIINNTIIDNLILDKITILTTGDRIITVFNTITN